MTSVAPDKHEPPVPETLADWFQLNAKYVTVGVAAIAAGAIGYWLYAQNAQKKAWEAERQLMTARRALPGNVQLATTDLRKVATNYGDTRAGIEAALLLGETMYAERKFAEGIDVLDDFVNRGSAEVVRAKLYGLIADGRMELGKPGEAAADYQRAAEAARFDGERMQYRAQRARALMVAGDTAAALKEWESLAAGDVTGIAAEARVRAGELAAASGSPAPANP